jgi:hypothetical protein
MELIFFNYSYNIFKNDNFELSKIKYNNKTFYCVQDILKCLEYNDNTIEVIKYLKELISDNDLEYMEQRLTTLSLDNNKQYFLKQIYIEQAILIELINSNCI